MHGAERTEGGARCGDVYRSRRLQFGDRQRLRRMPAAGGLLCAVEPGRSARLVRGGERRRLRERRWNIDRWGRANLHRGLLPVKQVSNSAGLQPFRAAFSDSPIEPRVLPSALLPYLLRRRAERLGGGLRFGRSLCDRSSREHNAPMNG